MEDFNKFFPSSYLYNEYDETKSKSLIDKITSQNLKFTKDEIVEVFEILCHQSMISLICQYVTDVEDIGIYPAMMAIIQEGVDEICNTRNRIMNLTDSKVQLFNKWNKHLREHARLSNIYKSIHPSISTIISFILIERKNDYLGKEIAEELLHFVKYINQNVRNNFIQQTIENPLFLDLHQHWINEELGRVVAQQ